MVALLLLLILHHPRGGTSQAFPHRSLLQTCQPSGFLTGKSGNCKTENGSECCKDGQRYTTYECSPRVTDSTRAKLTLNSFAEGGDGGGASACPPYKFYDDSKKVVALSTGWYAGGTNCGKHIVIRADNGMTVKAKVVDECDSRNGCDEEHNFEPPCHKNVVDGSPAVWDALRLNKDEGHAWVTWKWSDA
jgi:hypothetical protein